MLVPTVQAAEGQEQQQSLEELRNTVVNLLQALVEKGLLTREQAQLLVKQAQDKAAADAAKNAQVAKEEQNAVRVPYVPQIVKDEISKQVAEQVKPEVVQSVVAEAKTEKWGVPGALPEWLSRVHPFGDVTFRSQADMYAKDNTPNAILDFNGINSAGGIAKDAMPYLNTTENRDRFRLRARLGLDAELSPNFTSEIRLSSGSLTDPSSESQTEGTYGARYTVGLDRAFIRWNSSPAGQLSLLTAEGGRFDNPWFSPTELVYARDLQFEGAAGALRVGFGSGGADRSQVFATVGAIPVLEVPTEISENKWLLGAQIGSGLRWAEGEQHLEFAAGYYDFIHVTGVRNASDSTLTNVTAPAFIRYGNTVFDISNNPSDSTVNLFGLASHFRLADLAASYQLAFHRYSLAVAAEAVRNIGYKLSSIEALTQQPIASPQNKGYVADISFGDPTVFERGAWRARIGYRYVQSDAVIDAWTDADFHEGGTNATGYYLWGEFGLAKNTWIRVRYLSANEVTGARYGVDILQLDLNARF
jgi:predicted transcriptional regulator